MKFWRPVTKFNPRACILADRHYSRRTVGSNQFMPPGQTIVLLSSDRDSVFGWWRPDPRTGFVAMNGLDGWTCTIFHSESRILASDLILDAELAIEEFGFDCGDDGLLTYVWREKVKSKNPGYCFKCAGWKARGTSADGKKTLLRKPYLPSGVALIQQAMAL